MIQSVKTKNEGIMNKISQELTKSQALAIAAWHDEHSEKDGDRHSMIAFRLYKFAAGR